MRWIRTVVVAAGALMAAAAVHASGTVAPGPGAAAAATWTITPTPDVAGADNDLTAVSCPTTAFCVAVGTGAIESWNGTSWSIASPAALPAATYLQGVASASASFCEAVGFFIDSANHQVPLIETWDGVAWTAANVPTPAGAVDTTLDGVTCRSRSACTTVGHSDDGVVDHTVVESWNGTVWSIVPCPSPSVTGAVILLSVSCVSSAFCAAVGYEASSSSEQPLVEMWNGAEWRIVPVTSPAPGPDVQLLGVSCPSASFCVAVGADVIRPGQTTPPNLIETWNGTDWTNTSSTALSTQTLVGVVCTSSTRCVAVGAGSGQAPVESATVVANWNSSAWTVASTPNAGNLYNELNAVSCPSTSRCMAVGYSENSGGPQQALAEKGAVRPATVTELAATRAVHGKVVHLTARVSPASGPGTPTGSVTFADATTGLTLGTAPIRRGQATLDTVFSVKGQFTITATYSGDASFAPSNVSIVVTVAGRHHRRHCRHDDPDCRRSG